MFHITLVNGGCAYHAQQNRAKVRISSKTQLLNLEANMLKTVAYLFLLTSVVGCMALSQTKVTIDSRQPSSSDVQTPVQPPTLRQVGDRGFYILDGPFAEFDPAHASVDIWTPKNVSKPPIIVYAHGGAGFREDDQARIDLFRRHGYATISFDSYVMNGFADWNFVTRRVANIGKQRMIWGVFKGAIEYAATAEGNWDSDKILLYGGSNGARVALYAGSKLEIPNVRGIIAEAPAGSGFELGDYNIPTLIPFGALDTWAGKSDTDYVWTRTYPNSPISIENWVNSRRQDGHAVEFVFYKNAGHLLFDGPLEKVSIRRGDAISFTSHRGASDDALAKYETDVIAFADQQTR